jgi:hypothetical protein
MHDIMDKHVTLRTKLICALWTRITTVWAQAFTRSRSRGSFAEYTTARMTSLWSSAVYRCPVDCRIYKDDEREG